MAKDRVTQNWYQKPAHQDRSQQGHHSFSMLALGECPDFSWDRVSTITATRKKVVLWIEDENTAANTPLCLSGAVLTQGQGLLSFSCCPSSEETGGTPGAGSSVPVMPANSTFEFG